MGVTAAARKDEFRAVCEAEGADIIDNMTKGQPMRKLREHQEKWSPPERTS